MKNSIYLTVILTLSLAFVSAQNDQSSSDIRESTTDVNREPNYLANAHPEYRSPVNSQATNNIFSRAKKPIPFEKSNFSSLSMNAGTIVGLNTSGDTQFIAHYKRNKLKGNWISRFNEGQLCDSGSLYNNIPDGIWKSWFPNGQLRFIRTYDAFKLQKTKQDIALRQSKRINSSIAEIAKKNLRAAYSYLHPDYSFHTLAAHPETFSSFNDWLTLNERVANNIAQESVYFPPFVECLHHGLYINYYENGSIKDSGYYKNGLREGIWEEWLDNGATRSQGFYYRGHKVDTWKFFNTQGKLIYIRTYSTDGRRMFQKTFHS